MIAFGAADHAAAKILHIDHVGHQLIVDIRHQQIRTGEGLVELVPQLVDQMVECAGHLDLSVEVGILAQQCQCLAVEDHLDIGKAASARGADFVGPGEIDRARTRQRSF